ncbi:centromere protein H (CENP-H)-domain-containing protein [Calycina marina]|uniref:Centromere protein H (CENP-H)-domain-containing protein n=1 Tax=Calycina marina TaxID=1763456 RepID=A0A9P7ZBB3_9HELO|nr:centromere protein H (CENP-H)-domain-containing protein [Calycina marina]
MASDEMQGVMATAEHASTEPLMTDQERRILEVYGRLEELQLEIALLKAQGILPKGKDSAEVTEENIKTAQDELLKAKALYQVRNNIVENVFVANPILKAVHAGDNASVIEQDLLPLLHKRDKLSASLSGVSSQRLTTQKKLVKVESEHMILARENTELATEMLALAEDAKKQKKEDIKDPKARQKLEKLEAELKSSRQTWRIIKGAASATIVGSGVDWARNPKLLKIVLDDGDEN